MHISTIRRHLFSAVCILGTEDGTIDQRLRKVYLGDLRHISSDGLPVQVRTEYEKLMADLSDLFEGQGRINEARASQLAVRIVTLCDRVTDDV